MDQPNDRCPPRPSAWYALWVLILGLLALTLASFAALDRYVAACEQP